MLRHRGSTKIVLGAVAYLGFDMAVLQGAFVAIDAHPVPSFAVVSMCYLIGGLAGSIPIAGEPRCRHGHGRMSFKAISPGMLPPRRSYLGFSSRSPLPRFGARTERANGAVDREASALRASWSSPPAFRAIPSAHARHHP